MTPFHRGQCRCARKRREDKEGNINNTKDIWNDKNCDRVMKILFVMYFFLSNLLQFQGDNRISNGHAHKRGCIILCRFQSNNRGLLMFYSMRFFLSAQFLMIMMIPPPLCLKNCALDFQDMEYFPYLQEKNQMRHGEGSWKWDIAA